MLFSEVLDRLSQLFRPLPPVRTVATQESIQRWRGETLVESVDWAALTAVELMTTSGGPFVEDVFWILHGGDGGGCVVPNADAKLILERLQALEGFDNEAVIEAMGCATDCRWTLWRRERAG